MECFRFRNSTYTIHMRSQNCGSTLQCSWKWGKSAQHIFSFGWNRKTKTEFVQFVGFGSVALYQCMHASKMYSCRFLQFVTITKHGSLLWDRCIVYSIVYSLWKFLFKLEIRNFVYIKWMFSVQCSVFSKHCLHLFDWMFNSLVYEFNAALFFLNVIMIALSENKKLKILEGKSIPFWIVVVRKLF